MSAATTSLHTVTQPDGHRLAHQPTGHLSVLDGLRGVAIATVFLVHLYSLRARRMKRHAHA